MNYFFKIIGISLIVFVASMNAFAAKKINKNISISIEYEPGMDSIMAISLVDNIERELNLTGYSGRLKIVEKSAPMDTLEFRASIEVTKSGWETRRAFSIPFILNRYRRIFLVESILDIPLAGKKKARYFRSFAIKQSCGVQAQFLTNDKYDPDLFPDQNEKIRTEDAGYQELAKELAKGLTENLK